MHPETSPAAVGSTICPPWITDRIVHAKHPHYDDSRAVWNGRVTRRPELIVQAAGVEDVIWAVNTARAEGKRLAVRGAGHSVQGHGVCDDGIVLDLSRMKGLTVDADARTALAGPGLTIGEFTQGIQAHGLMTTVGSHSSVGLAGFALGGGVGFLMGRYGLACDNLLSAQIVTADGTLRTASADENPDLFWAIRGGGGNFGVVVSLVFQLHPAGLFLAGPTIHPGPRAAQALRFYRDFAPTCPDELTVAAVITTGPEGRTACLLMPVYAGSPEVGEQLIAPLKEFGPPVAAHVHPMPYSGVLGLLEGRDLAGAHYAYTSRGLMELSDAVIDIIAEFGLTKTSPGTSVVIHNQHGAMSRVGGDATPYPARHVPYIIGIYAGWETGDPQPHEDWLHRFEAALEPYAVKECCISLTGSGHQDSVRDIYGANYGRLAELKAKWDPENLFCNNHNIPPAAKAV